MRSQLSENRAQGACYARCPSVFWKGAAGVPLHTNLQAVNFQRWKCASGSSKKPEPVPSASGMSEIAACPHLLLLTNLQLCHLPPPFPPSVSNSSYLFTRCQLLCASCCTVLLYFSRYYTVRFKCFLCFLCIICIKSFINLLQYSTIEPIVLVEYLG